MTTPNIEELIATTQNYLQFHKHHAFFASERDVANKLTEALQSQAERIKVLELDLDVQAGSIEAVQAVNARQAERIKELERTPQVGYFYKWKEAMHGIAKLMDERDTLRAQLSEIAATEPVLVVEKEPDYWSGGHFHEGSKPHIKPTKVWRLPIGTKLFTRPMPAQDVTELVELLEFMWREVSMNDYAFEKLEAALSKYKGVK